jgi:hypothetical protein
MLILLCKLVLAWMNNRGTALAILREMEGVAGEIQRGHRGHDDRDMEPFMRDRRSGSRRIGDPLRDPVDVGRRRAGSLQPFDRQQGLVFQRGGSLPPQEMDLRRERSRSATPLDRHSRASSVASELSDVMEEEGIHDEYLPPPRRNVSPFPHSPIANRTRQR